MVLELWSEPYSFASGIAEGFTACLHIKDDKQSDGGENKCLE